MQTLHATLERSRSSTEVPLPQPWMTLDKRSPADPSRGSQQRRRSGTPAMAQRLSFGSRASLTKLQAAFGSRRPLAAPGAEAPVQQQQRMAAAPKAVPDDNTWERQALERRRMGAKPRVKRKKESVHFSSEISEKLDEAFQLSGGDTIRHDSGSELGAAQPPSPKSSGKNRRPLTNLVSWVRAMSTASSGSQDSPENDPWQTNQKVLDMHKVAMRRSASTDRVVTMPKVTPGFDNFGHFVSYHRGLTASGLAAAELDGSARSPSTKHEAAAGEEAAKSARGTVMSGAGTDECDEEAEARTPILLEHAASDASERRNRQTALLEEEDAEMKKFVEVLEIFREALRCNNVAQVAYILDGGGRAMGNSSCLPRGFHVDFPSETGETAALAAARGGRAELCAMLLDRKADPMARDTNPEFFRDAVWPDEHKPNTYKSSKPRVQGAQNGLTVVYHLRLAGIFDSVLLLVFPMTRVALVRAISEALEAYYYKPALVYAATRGLTQLAAVLLTHTQPTHTASRWSTCKAGTPVLNERAAALLMACTHCQWACAEVILAAGVANTSLDTAVDPPGRTALHLAAASGQRHTARLLLKAGASTTVYSGYGRQPLHDACASGHIAVARSLVDHGADPQAKVKLGKKGIPWKGVEVGLTAMRLAERRGHGELHDYLAESERTRGLPTPRTL